MNVLEPEGVRIFKNRKVSESESVRTFKILNVSEPEIVRVFKTDKLQAWMGGICV